MLAAAREVVAAAPPGERFTIVDLCSGKGFLSMVLSELLPSERVERCVLVDKAWPPLNDLCARLGERFRYAFANLYFTPHASQTAPPHSDDRDVFVLQMHGAKRWRVWACDHCDAQLLPFADEQAGKVQEFLHAATEKHCPQRRAPARASWISHRTLDLVQARSPAKRIRHYLMADALPSGKWQALQAVVMKVRHEICPFHPSRARLTCLPPPSTGSSSPRLARRSKC